MSKPGYADQAFWMRLIFMLIYWFVLNISITIFGFLLLILVVIKFGSQFEPTSLSKIVNSLSVFISQIFSYLSFRTEDKPFPFQKWPMERE